MKPSTVCFCLNLIFLADHVLAQSSSLSLQQDVRSCTSCVDRSQKTIHAFYHGNEGDPFWRPIVAAANQASINHQVKLKTTLFSSFDAAAMAQDIRQAVQNGGADALIVSTSPPEVRQAVTEAIEEGVAVFGLNSGYNDDTGTQTTSSNNMGFAATIGQDEFRAGQVAAIRFLEAKDVIHKAVFVIEETGQSAMEQRLEGFRQVLLEAHPDAVVEQVQVEDISNPFVSFDVERKLKPFLATCDCDIVLSSGARVSPQVLKYLQHWNQECRQTANFDRTFFGAFDATNDVITRIETGDVLFAISQQPYLQATVPVLLASLYVTTGKILANPSAPIITGPVLIDASNLQSNKLHYCSNLGEIGCKDRATIRIGAVLDNHTAAGQGGQELRAGAEQASRDVGVSLDMFVLEEGSMSEKIESLCQQGVVDGLFISLSSASEAETVQDCESLGVRVIILETEFEHDLEFLKSVGRFQQDNGDTAANYFQGYLPIALLSCKCIAICIGTDELSKESLNQISLIICSIYQI
ncbi:periplasmic binding protein/LacI transcriptional regulator [Nitzschia inconspicua]|uniref:Periplasmic binding protein/LacI transcriptional regulator n=1 Tax=Nitzschia inconspicua TaxID=303405 RepID=A0A9K3KWH5_9STRA|nr:periplasmic binding protein/LacI transcriptional regulator [Nitzschia inconspicua]